MATLDRPDDNTDGLGNERKNNYSYGLDFYPDSASRMTLSQQLEFKILSDKYKTASREQLYCFLLETHCLYKNTQNMVNEFVRQGKI